MESFKEIFTIFTFLWRRGTLGRPKKIEISLPKYLFWRKFCRIDLFLLFKLRMVAKKIRHVRWSSFFWSGRHHFLGQVVFIFWVKSSSFLGQVFFIYWVRSSSFFVSGRLHFLDQVVFIFCAKSSSYSGSSHLHFLGQVVFIFWVRSSSFLG